MLVRMWRKWGAHMWLGSVQWSSCVGNSWDVCLQPLHGPHAPKNPTQERTQQPASGDNTVTHLHKGAGQEDGVSPLPWGVT